MVNDKESTNALSIAIRRRMAQKNIGNKELSERSGVPLRTVNNILLGITLSPSINVVMEIAKALECTIDDFVDDSFAKEHAHYFTEAYRIDQLFFQLNEEGQERLISYAEDLIASGRYIKNNQDGMVDEEA